MMGTPFAGLNGNHHNDAPRGCPPKLASKQAKGVIHFFMPFWYLILFPLYQAMYSPTAFASASKLPYSASRP